MDGRFADRADAGHRLAARLAPYAAASPIVLGIPRGGVPVADEVARALGAPLEAWVVRKIGVPGEPELGLGAVAEGGTIYLSRVALADLGITPQELEPTIEREAAEVQRRAALFRAGRPPPDLTGQTVILVDDGIAMGGTARAALRSIRERRPGKLVLAVPVASSGTLEELRHEVDDLVCLLAPEALWSIGGWYDDFAQVSDEEVSAILGRRPPAARPPAEAEVRIEAGGVALPGRLEIPAGALGLVLFAHGSGSSRLSPRNRAVAAALREQRLGTLLFDLLTAEEQWQASLRFDIPLLAERLLAATDWLAGRPEAAGLAIGYFGSSTGASAALVAASRRPQVVGAVVSRGGRPDLAEEALSRVKAPTLLLVGGADLEVLALNKEAASRLTCPVELSVIPGATHMFEEPGALEAVAARAAAWFVQHLPGRAVRQPALPGVHV